MLKLKKNIFQRVSVSVNIATNFMVLSYKSLNVGPKHDSKVSSLIDWREEKEPWHGTGGWKGGKVAV